MELVWKGLLIYTCIREHDNETMFFLHICMTIVNFNCLYLIGNS